MTVRSTPNAGGHCLHLRDRASLLDPKRYTVHVVKIYYITVITRWIVRDSGSSQTAAQSTIVLWLQDVQYVVLAVNGGSGSSNRVACRMNFRISAFLA